MVFAYPSDSGQDYGVIEMSNGMRHRVMSGGDGWELVDNPFYQPRTPEQVSELMKQRG